MGYLSPFYQICHQALAIFQIVEIVNLHIVSPSNNALFLWWHGLELFNIRHHWRDGSLEKNFTLIDARISESSKKSVKALLGAPVLHLNNL